jgi:hypothetical protein
MDANQCNQERFSSRTIGFIFLTVSALLFAVGMLVLPVIGFVFAIPFTILGVVMLLAPESKACRMIRQGIRMG